MSREAFEKMAGLLHLSEPSDDPGRSEWPACDHCSLPAICFGADLTTPSHRCPRCCREHRQFGGVHGDPGPVEAHISSEGVAL